MLTATKPIILESAYQALSAAFLTWYELEDRIRKGRTFIAAHPTDKQATALLSELTGKAERARGRYDEANHRYKLAVTNEEIKSI